MELGFSVQLHHEGVLHRQLLLHTLSHESQVPVRQPSPHCLCQMVANPRLSDQLTTLPSTHSRSNTSLDLAWFSVSSSTTSSGCLKSCGHSPSSSRRSPFSHNYSCCKGQERRKPLRLITLPLWERTGLSTFQIGYIGTCGGHSPSVASILTGFSAFRNRWYVEDTVDIIAVLAGLVQTGLYADFFYVYFTK
jgi:hypothetical protein